MTRGKKSRRVDFEVSRRLSYCGKQYIPGDRILGIWEEEASYMEEIGWGKIIVTDKNRDHDL